MRFIGVFLMAILAWAALGQTQDMTMQTTSQTPSYSVSLETIYADTYVFRGRVLDPDPSLQGQLVLGFGRFSYSLFHHAASEGNTDQFKEYTHSAEYTTLAGNTIQTMGYRFYDYSDFRPTTQEFFYRVSHYTPWHPTYGVAYDFDTYRGYYMDFSMTRPMQLTRSIQFIFGLGAALSYDMEEKSSRQDGVMEAGMFEDEGFSHANARGSFVWRFSQRMSMDLGYTYHHAFDELLKQDPDTGKNLSTWQASFTITIP